MDQESEGTNLVIFVVGGVVLLLLLLGGGAFFFLMARSELAPEPAVGPAFDPAFIEEQKKAAMQTVSEPPMVEPAEPGPMVIRAKKGPEEKQQGPKGPGEPPLPK